MALTNCVITFASAVVGKKELEQAAVASGAAVRASVTKDVTHVIVDPNRTSMTKPPASMKKVFDRPDDIVAIALSWLDKCCSSGTRLPEGDYVVFGGKAEWRVAGDTPGDFKPLPAAVSNDIEAEWRANPTPHAYAKHKVVFEDFDIHATTSHHVHTINGKPLVRFCVSPPGGSAAPTAPVKRARGVVKKEAVSSSEDDSGSGSDASSGSDDDADAPAAKRAPPKPRGKAAAAKPAPKPKPKAKAKAKGKTAAADSGSGESSSDSESESSSSGSDDDDAKPAAPAIKSVPVQVKSRGATSGLSAGSAVMLRKGRGVVDAHFPQHAEYHVYEDDKDVYMATLQQTNMTGGQNNNKFYQIQALQHDTRGTFGLWTRWGRVGEPGQSNFQPFANKDAALAAVRSKFLAKTKNHFDTRMTAFEKRDGFYNLIHNDFGDDAEDAKPAKAEGDTDGDGDDAADAKCPDCTLHPSVQTVMSMISDTSAMVQSMRELEIDASRCPLGKLSKETITKAYNTLKKLEALIDGGVAPGDRRYAELSQDFYNDFPTDTGRRAPPSINNVRMLQAKIKALESLAELQVASKLLKTEGPASTEHPLDSIYAKLQCAFQPVDKASSTYDLINRYLTETHGGTHYFKLALEDVFEIDRAGEKSRFDGTAGNRMLLWHGSRTTNYMGILSQGLRIAPPEAPKTGYMFGKGVYFADVVSKSAQYCMVHTDTSGLMLLCEVALGKPFKSGASIYMEAPQDGTHSTHGVGKNVPDPTTYVTLDDGCVVPVGKTKDNDDPEVKYLQYNEFIVYDVAQVRLRYLCKVKFSR